MIVSLCGTDVINGISRRKSEIGQDKISNVKHREKVNHWQGLCHGNMMHEPTILPTECIDPTCFHRFEEKRANYVKVGLDEFYCPRES